MQSNRNRARQARILRAEGSKARDFTETNARGRSAAPQVRPKCDVPPPSPSVPLPKGEGSEEGAPSSPSARQRRRGALFPLRAAAKKGRPLPPLPPGEGWGEGNSAANRYSGPPRSRAGPEPRPAPADALYLVSGRCVFSAPADQSSFQAPKPPATSTLALPGIPSARVAVALTPQVPPIAGGAVPAPSLPKKRPPHLLSLI